MADADIAYENVANICRHFAPIDMLAVLELDIDRARGIQLFFDSIRIHIYLFIYFFFFFS